tara:strand:- start:94 stop:513 length:420 start_codon:yes stop_codon:yes gene_type:complete
MARITVEDSILKIPSRFELVLIASQRARKLHTGDPPTIEKENDKNTVIALREIEEETISLDILKENLIKDYQVTSTYESEDETDNSSVDSKLESKENISEDIEKNNQISEIENKKIMENQNEIDESINISTENSVSETE